MRPPLRLLALAALAATVAACSSDDGATQDTTSPGATTADTTTADTTTDSGPADADVADPELRAELLAMMDEDQAEQLGEVQTNNYTARTERLTETMAEFGWLTFDLVGEDGSTAAWVIAEHADLDPEVQATALELLRVVVADGQASPGNLAYLEDRVAVAAGNDQRYGTQMGCSEDGTPLPATPSPTRPRGGAASGGWPRPAADYIEEMTAVCADTG